MLTEIKNGRKRAIISQQIMTLRIQKAKKLREAYEATSKLMSDNRKLPAEVVKVLESAQSAAWMECDKAERKVVVAVQKKFSGFMSACALFELNIDAWPDDPTLTVLPENDTETEEDEKEENAE